MTLSKTKQNKTPQIKFKKKNSGNNIFSPFIDAAFICMTTTYFSAVNNTEPKKN